jgi:hypothetical protein
LVNIKNASLQPFRNKSRKIPELGFRNWSYDDKGNPWRKVLEISRNIPASAKIGEREHNSPMFKCLEIFYLY